jgi:aspartyl/asparaginyl beta-hydroxylase (cupin superfamily)
MNIQLSDKNPKLFYESSDFPFLQPLISNFEIIKKELLDLINSKQEDQWLNTFPSYVESKHNKAWKVFTFIFYGMKFPSHSLLCPKTAELIYSIKEIISCDYSYLNPNTHIKAHKGYTKMVLRCHLPLIVPAGNLCSLRVGDETRQWKEGELMIFDDSYEHEAWNNSNEKRVVLMFDIPNSLWGYSAHEISKYKVKHIEDSFLLSIADKTTWLKAFEKGIFPLETFS